MTRYVAASAGVVWLLAWGVLGTDWAAHVDTLGRPVDAVSLRQWALFWALLVGFGLLIGHRLDRRLGRALALLPTLVFLAVQLWSPLGPIPLVIYLGPTIVAWWVAASIGTMLQARLARSVKS